MRRRLVHNMARNNKYLERSEEVSCGEHAIATAVHSLVISATKNCTDLSQCVNSSRCLITQSLKVAAELSLATRHGNLLRNAFLHVIQSGKRKFKIHGVQKVICWRCKIASPSPIHMPLCLLLLLVIRDCVVVGELHLAELNVLEDS